MNMEMDRMVNTNSLGNKIPVEQEVKTAMEEQMMIDTGTDLSTWTQLAESLYDFLNRRNTTIEYNFVNMEIMVPKSTGVDPPQAHWKLNGALRIRTWEG